MPTKPPNIIAPLDQCFSSTVSTDTVSGDPASGRQFANMSCSQIAGRTFEYWFNDMGGGQAPGVSGTVDERDYNDLKFVVQCTSTTTKTGGVNGAASSTVSLLK